MSYGHFLRCSRSVRIGGRKVFRWHIGGGSYTVGPLSVIRWLQFFEAAGQLPFSEQGIADGLKALTMLRPMAALVPILVAERIKPKHLERITPAQVATILAAFAEVNDITYFLSITKPGDGGGERIGIERVAIDLAERFGLDPYDVLHWPMAQFCGVLDALKEREPEKPPEDDGLGAVLKGLGVAVS